VRLVLDTNVVIAAFVARGACHELLEHCERSHQMVGSELILQELESKLLRKFRVPPEKASAAVALVRSQLELIVPVALEEQVCRGPDDDWILATALAGRCECIITGDKDLLALQTFAGIRILSPGAFLAYESERGPLA
jgi:putative PIN family toxin of toxin-antitoxin system